MASPGELVVAVFGLGWQPQLVNLAYPPCLLLPIPDLVLQLPPISGVLSLSIPAAARPVTLLTQGVVLTAFGTLATTDGFQVVAF